MTVRGIAHDIPQKVPRMPSISGIYLLAEGSRCHFAPVGPPCPTFFPASLHVAHLPVQTGTERLRTVPLFCITSLVVPVLD